MPSYQDVVGSAFYATGETPSRPARAPAGNVLTAGELRKTFETPIEFDDPSNHGELYSNQRLATRTELEAFDRRLVAVPVSKTSATTRPIPDDLAKAPSKPADGDMSERDFDGSCLRSGCHQQFSERA
jgi:hypothetical protein